MWTRSELKDSAKGRMNANYWKSVLAALILMVVLGGSARVNYNVNTRDIGKGVFGTSGVSHSVEGIQDDLEDASEDIESALSELGIALENIGISDFDDFDIDIDSDKIEDGLAATIAAIVAVVLGIVLFATAIAICIKIFLKNPLEIGGRGFFIENHSTEATISNYGTAFKSNYMNTVLVMFLRDLFTWLWSLLLIVPGIVKSYEYRMIPYLLAEDTSMSYKDAFEESKRMMTGNKWNAFVLDLSFIGWHLLNGLTLGILGIFYVNPYVYQTSAELYIKLKGDETGYGVDEFPEYNNYIEVE